jgi:hypothetical protein
MSHHLRTVFNRDRKVDGPFSYSYLEYSSISYCSPSRLGVQVFILRD